MGLRNLEVRLYRTRTIKLVVYRQLTVYAENIFLTGSVDALKNWSPDKALLLSSANYPIWSSMCCLIKTPCHFPGLT
jgi:hypothetical protein